MTERTYKNTVNSCLLVAGLAVFFFDSFATPLIPGGAIVAAGLLPLSLHVYARFRGLHEDLPPEVAGEPLPVSSLANLAGKLSLEEQVDEVIAKKSRGKVSSATSAKAGAA